MKLSSIISRAAARALSWAAELGRDAALWPVNLLRDLPVRLDRLGETVIEGAAGMRRAAPQALNMLHAGDHARNSAWMRQKAAGSATWLLSLSTRLFDLAGGPDLGELLIHLGSHCEPLAPAESAAARAVLGPLATRWGAVRVAQGGLLELIFQRNGGRAFTTWRTINMPAQGHNARANLEIVVHELTHVLQYERVGTIYMLEALRAQASAESYDYGKLAGLDDRWKTQQHLCDLNREQQASVAQDYFRECILDAASQPGGALADLRRRYRPWIEELRAGRV
jgi:hypothetical protein